MESKKATNAVPESLETKVSEAKDCFVIMPISDPEGYPKGHFEKIYRDIFIPAIEKAGFNPVRVDKDFTSSSILAKIINNLVNAPIALCDLSSRNPNVLYELGIRQAFDMPVVLVHEAGSRPIFDIADITTISYRKERIYDEVFEDQNCITQALTSTAKDNKGKSSVIHLTKIEKARKEEFESSPQEKSDLMLQSLANDISFIKEAFALLSNNTASTVKKYLSPATYRVIEKLCDELMDALNVWEFEAELPDSAVIELRNSLATLVSFADNDLQQYKEPEQIIDQLRSKISYCRYKYSEIIHNKDTVKNSRGTNGARTIKRTSGS